MEKFIRPAAIDGAITAPSSKSDMLRAVAAAYLTGAACELLRPSYCDDALAALHIVETLGADVTRATERVMLAPSARQPGTRLDCGESGLCIRMFPAIAARSAQPVTLTGRGSLLTRPLAMLEQPLRALGVACATANGLPPLTVQGPLRAGKTAIDGSITSQFLTGLLMALPLCDGDSELLVTNLTSKPYIAMTLSLLEKFGVRVVNENFERFAIPGNQAYQARTHQVEGDWSGAAFPMVAGAIAGRVTVNNLQQDSLQADAAILDALRRAGAEVEIAGDAVTVRRSRLAGFEFDATNCPDLFPPLVALAACCDGKSVIHGAQRLAVKESDRGLALRQEFSNIGGTIDLFADRMEIFGHPLDGGAIDSHHDHRIAMACAVAALRSARGVAIHGAECVAKSYPKFFEDLQQLMQYGAEKD